MFSSSIGVGITLTAADTCIIVDSDWYVGTVEVCRFVPEADDLAASTDPRSNGVVFFILV